MAASFFHAADHRKKNIFCSLGWVCILYACFHANVYKESTDVYMHVQWGVHVCTVRWKYEADMSPYSN